MEEPHGPCATTQYVPPLLDENQLVSVVVPCYNQGHFLSESIGSALSQSYPKVEVIVVDDGSTDHTAEVAASFDGVRYIWQENQGAGAARNTGLAASSGAYVVFLDADDRLLPRAIEAGVQSLTSNPHCALTFGHYRNIDAHGRVYATPPEPPARPDYGTLLRSNCIHLPAVVMFRRSIFSITGGFDTCLKNAEDYDIYLRVARRFPICCHDTRVAEYRAHEANKSRNTARAWKSVKQILDSQLEHIRDNDAGLQAYRAGVLFFRHHYGWNLTVQLTAALQERRWDNSMTAARLLLQLYPRGFLYIASRVLLPEKALSALQRVRRWQRSSPRADY